MKSGRQGQEGRVSGPNTRQCDTVLASVKDASRRQEGGGQGAILDSRSARCPSGRWSGRGNGQIQSNNGIWRESKEESK